jgi:hypothetical protein
MLHARALLLAGALLVTGACATPDKRAGSEMRDQKALGERIERICALPATERAAEIKRLQAELGMMLYCGK